MNPLGTVDAKEPHPLTPTHKTIAAPLRNGPRRTPRTRVRLRDDAAGEPARLVVQVVHREVS